MLVQKHSLPIIERASAIESLSCAPAGAVCRLILLEGISNLGLNYLDRLDMQIQVSVQLLGYLLGTVLQHIVVEFHLVAVVSTVDLNPEKDNVFVLTDLARRLLLMTNLVNC